jgi:hypothetical protein
VTWLLWSSKEKVLEIARVSAIRFGFGVDERFRKLAEYDNRFIGVEK